MLGKLLISIALSVLGEQETVTAVDLAAADVVVTRTVTADQLAKPQKIDSLGRGKCPERISKPASGDLVRLSVSPGMARRDEPSLAIIVRLDIGKAFVLHPPTATYRELAYPPKTRQLENGFRTGIGTAAAELFPFVAEGSVRETTVSVAGRNAVVRALSISSQLLYRREVEVMIAPDPVLAPAAFAVESLVQAMRNNAEEWLSLVGGSDGILLGLGETVHQPSLDIDYTEDFTTLEEVDLDPALFTPPAEYKKVKYDAACFFSP
jgi:hypothetical protein